MRCNDDESEKKVMSFGNDRSSYAFEHPGICQDLDEWCAVAAPIRSPWVCGQKSFLGDLSFQAFRVIVTYAQVRMRNELMPLGAN